MLEIDRKPDLKLTYQNNTYIFQGYVRFVYHRQNRCDCFHILNGNLVVRSF